MKTVFVVVTHGFHVKNILYTDIFKKIKKKCKIVIFCPLDDVKNFKEEFEDENVLIEPILNYSSKIEDKLLQVRRFIFTSPSRSRTINIFIMSMKINKRFKYYLLKIGNNLLGRFKPLRELWLNIERFFITGMEYQPAFSKYNPSLVLTPTYGTQPVDIRLLRCAKKNHVKTVSIVQSWDNLSSKGIIGERPDKLIVWGDIMKSEAIEIHDYNENDIFLAGAPQFDIYARSDLFRNRQEFCRDMGLDPDKKIILYGTITPRYFPHNVEIINIISESINKQLVKYPCQVIVRFHPQVVDNSIWSDTLSDYADLEDKYPFVKCDIPKIKKWNSMSPLELSDSLHLAEMLYHADVCINPGSTLTIDAAIMDTPAIGIGFDGYKAKPYESSIRRWYDFTYYRPVLKTGGIKIAYSSEELVKLINAYLKDPAMDREGRRKIREIEFLSLDGHAGERAARYIYEQIRI